MYLVCCPNIHMEEMVECLVEINVVGIPLPLLDFNFDTKKLQIVKEQINNFDYVMLSSPSSIEYIAEAITLATTPKFITVGTASAKRIAKYTEQEIICVI